ncbi:hypothetical protein MKW94_017394, partial [Papaver nudicaule]|nr:hypothetical protein [Papaver nudicaule]
MVIYFAVTKIINLLTSGNNVRAGLEMALIDAVATSIGFSTLKPKVGKNLNADIEVLKAIRVAHPECSFMLDANDGYTSSEAIKVLDRLHEMGVTILFEQPVHRDDWESLGHVTQVAKQKYGISVAADESCRSLSDVEKIIEGNLVDVINIKLAKIGVLGALEIINGCSPNNKTFPLLLFTG